ncbi:MAG: ferrochelatase [Planctomycetaceae bacterium]|jgi:ferrochelatase|nr:ferrochelatase [Planctomycetaceae bacterium]
MVSKTFLLISYGAPEVKEEVIPFLHNLLANKTNSAVLSERITVAAEKYYKMARQTGRLSPLNSECRKLIAGIIREAEQNNIPLNVYWGNLFWHPLLEDTVAEMTRDEIQHAVCFTTSIFDSGTSNKRYTDALETARQKVGVSAPIFEKLLLPLDHPLFIEAHADRLLEALTLIVPDKGQYDGKYDRKYQEITNSVLVLFSAHSIPKSDTACFNYVNQLRQTCRSIIEKCYTPAISWEIVFQSRSGGTENWLGPDIKERIGEIAASGQYRTIVVSPVGFFCENMETINDLDLELGEICNEFNLGFIRAKTIGTLPKIHKMIVQEIKNQNLSADDADSRR